MTIYVKRYNGSAWVDGTVKRYNGTSWVDAYTYKWNGSAWQQIYPETAVSTTRTISGGSTSTTWSYRAQIYQNWKQEDAKQGNGGGYSSSSGSGDSTHYGYLNLSSSKFIGYKNINSVSSAYYTGTRGGSGTYSVNQTIKFYRGSVVPTSASSTSPVGNTSGVFTATTGGPGSGGAITNKTISGLTNLMSWMNAVSNKDKLYIYSSSSADYLSLRGQTSIKASYVYIASSATYALDSAPTSTYSLKSTRTTSFASGLTLEEEVPSNNPNLHTIILYPEEVGMTLEEVMAYREENNLDDISINDVLTDYIKQIQLKDFNIDYDNHIVEVVLDGLKEGHIPEFSIDGDNYYSLSSPSVDTYIGDLTSEFDRNRDYVYIRVRNKIKDNIDFEYIEEPLFLVI